MTLENHESNTVDSAENEGLTQEELESVAGGSRPHNKQKRHKAHSKTVGQKHNHTPV